jgi:NAD(P)H-hydrate repair Nnr-like enzyme with NAD(P)H-hydrate dehydratase domain
MYKEEEIISVTPELIQELLPTRLVSSKKGDNGIVLVVGGSGIYHGAPLLSTLAALRSGVDLVYTAVPKSNVSAKIFKSRRFTNMILLACTSPSQLLTLS